jgi:2'-5' RNA ligase
MYGVIALFDEKTENQINSIWNELYERGLSYYSKEVLNRRPHITIATYQRLETGSFIKLMDEFFNETDHIPVTLSALGTFLQSRTIFLSPTPTKILFDWHRNYHEKFKSYNDDLSSLYLPEKWIPHCTIANHLTEEQFYKTFQYCTDNIQTIHAHIQEVALIKLEYKNEKCIRTSLVFSKKLKNETIKQ